MSPVAEPSCPMVEESAALPPTEDLGQAQVERLFGVLRARRVALMERLAGLSDRAAAAGRAQEPAAMLDRMEAQTELMDLLGYLRRLQARAKQLESWLPADRISPQFEQLAGQGRRWVAARARCPQTPDSVLFIHGPVALYFTAALAEQLLAPGDRLAWLRRAAFHQELAHEPRILVWDPDGGDPPETFERGRVCFQGRFETARGRSLAFAAVPDLDHPAALKADYHPLVPIIAARPPRLEGDRSRLRYRLRPGDWPAGGQRLSSAESVFALTEYLVTTVNQALDDGRRLYLFSTIADRAIPEDFTAWLAAGTELQVDLDWDRQRQVPGRGMFVPGRYRMLPTDQAWQRGLLACLDSHLLF